MKTACRSILFWFGFGVALVLLASCAPAPRATPAPEATKALEVPVTAVVEKETKLTSTAVVVKPAEPTTAPGEKPTEPPKPTTAPQASPPPTVVALSPTLAIQVEERVVELEWPPRMRWGESDFIRMALILSKEGYKLTTEFPEHDAQSQTVQVARPGGYDLYAAARIDGVGFTISPEGEQRQYLSPGETVTWRWSITPRNPGKHYISITLLLRWIPVAGASGSERVTVAYSKSLAVRVSSFMGLTHAQASTTGFFGLIFGGGLSLFAFAFRPKVRSIRLPGLAILEAAPNPQMVIEPKAGISLTPTEQALLQSLFGRYARLSVEQEFLSGYSGARTFLVLPIRPDGRADAYTIAKLGDQETIQQEFANYETFVKDTLPPVTARIQHPPVMLHRLKRPTAGLELAALQYTFIGEPGSTPTSLRQSLLENPEPAFLYKLFETFGPNWWMQHRPYTFRLALEYDRLLPTHLVIEPAVGKSKVLDEKTSPSKQHFEIGDLVTLGAFHHCEMRRDGQSLSLRGEPITGQPPLRIRWMSLQPPKNTGGRVVSTRLTLLRDFVSGFDLFGLPDPLKLLPSLLDECIQGTQSNIHGDLNLENILVGPGNFVWLIDFAQTREGHPLFDFAHLEAEIIAHVIAPQVASPEGYLAILQEGFRQTSVRPTNKLVTLLSAVHEIAGRCLFNPTQPREYQLALSMACLGALKYANLKPFSKHLLYLTAAYLVQSL